ERLTPRACLGVVRFDPCDQPLPRDHRVHLGKKPLASGHFPLLVPSDRGERPLISHHPTSSRVNHYSILHPKSIDLCRFSLGHELWSSRVRGRKLGNPASSRRPCKAFLLPRLQRPHCQRE